MRRRFFSRSSSFFEDLSVLSFEDLLDLGGGSFNWGWGGGVGLLIGLAVSCDVEAFFALVKLKSGKLLFELSECVMTG